jgi:hypothetical protein
MPRIGGGVCWARVRRDPFLGKRADPSLRLAVLDARPPLTRLRAKRRLDPQCYIDGAGHAYLAWLSGMPTLDLSSMKPKVTGFESCRAR